MMPASSQVSVRYDETETLEQFQARQKHAYAVGERVWYEGRIKAHHLKFYDELVRRVGANRYAWPSEPTLADTCRVSVSTIKRWLAKLEAEGLIRRQRRLATSSATFITAYELDHPAANDALDDEQPIQLEAADDRVAASSFETKDEPTLSSSLVHDHLKTQHLNEVGGGSNIEVNDTHIQPDVSAILEAEGVLDPEAMRDLSTQTPDELRAVASYLNKQRNVHNRPGLFVWLARKQFGQRLIRGRHRRAERSCTTSVAPATDHTKYVAGALSYLIHGAAPSEQDQVSPPPEHTDGPDTSPPRGVSEGDNSTHVWQSVLQSLQQTVPASEFATWFHDTALLALEPDGQAVIGTANVFACETVRERWSTQIADLLQRDLGPSIQVEVVIGRG